jgi:hypothetical protein
MGVDLIGYEFSRRLTEFPWRITSEWNSANPDHITKGARGALVAEMSHGHPQFAAWANPEVPDRISAVWRCQMGFASDM